MKALRYITKRRVMLGLLALSLLSCLLAPKGGQRVRTAASTLLAPISHVGTSVISRVRDNVATLDTGQLSVQEAAILREQNSMLRAQALSYEQSLAYQRELISRLQYWRDVVPPEQFPCVLVLATVVGGDSLIHRYSRLLHTATATKPGAPVTTLGLIMPEEPAIEPNKAVLSSTALVGRIAESGPWTARVQTVLDAGFQVKAVVYRRIVEGQPVRMVEEELTHTTRPLGPDDPPVPVTVKGTGRERMTTLSVPALHNFQPGDEVLTERDSSLPVGIRVGTVTAVHFEPNNPGLVRLEVAPAVNLRTLRDVLVVMPTYLVPGQAAP